MDVFENGEVTLGGAPFNVVFHLHQLLRALSLGEAVFVSSVGNDVWGRQIRAAVEAAGMTAGYLAEASRPTGSALVFEHRGGAGFEIRPDVAWDAIAIGEAGLALARRSQAVVFGSLAQRSEASRCAIRHFVSQVNGHRLYDVNLRRNTTDGVAGYSTEIVVRSLRLATVVKMNDAELEEVAALLGFTAEARDPEDRTRLFMERLRAEFALHAVAITRGARGALLTSEGKQLGLPDSSLDQSLVHPVGAGDSFAAGLLFGIVQGWPPGDCLALAELLSSWVVRHVSATPPLPASVLVQVRSLMTEAEQKPTHAGKA
ncbi:MAG: PfkB family carbohydrate kinase [Terracidiphilus sp.]